MFSNYSRQMHHLLCASLPPLLADNNSVLCLYLLKNLLCLIFQFDWNLEDKYTYIIIICQNQNVYFIRYYCYMGAVDVAPISNSLVQRII